MPFVQREMLAMKQYEFVSPQARAALFDAPTVRLIWQEIRV